MAYINEPYKIVYIAKNFTSGLTDVELIVFKPNMSKMGVYVLTEMQDPEGAGIYYIDFNDADVVGVYTFVVDSVTMPLKDVRSLYFDQRFPIVVNPMMDEIVEGSINVQQSLQIMLSVLAGKSSGGGTTKATFRNVLDTHDKVVAIVDNVGNRHNVNIT